MGRRLALVAEIFEGSHEAATEEGLPLAIDRDAGGEGILGCEEPAGERQAIGRGVLGQVGEEGGHRRRDFFLGAEVFAAVVAEGRTRVGGRTFAHDERRLAAGDLLAEVGERLRLCGELRGGLEEALAQLRLVLRGAAGEHGFDLGGVARGGGLRVGAYGDAEMPHGAGVMLFEQHLDRPAGGKVGRFFEMEDGGMVLAETAEHLPAAGHLAVERGGGVVLLAVGGGLGGFRRLGGGFRGAGGVVDPILFLVVGRRGGVEA